MNAVKVNADKIAPRGSFELSTKDRADSASELGEAHLMAGMMAAAAPYRKEGLYEKALLELDAVLKADPKHLGAQIERNAILVEQAVRGNEQRNEETSQQALANLRNLTEDHPKCWQAHVAYGDALAVMGQLDKALNAYDFALDTKPNDPDIIEKKSVTLIALINSASENGNYDEAKTLYRGALAPLIAAQSQEVLPQLSNRAKLVLNLPREVDFCGGALP